MIFSKTPKMHDVESSAIKSLGYKRHNLRIEFNSGHCYTYKGVDKREFKMLMRASSVGRAFHDTIKGSYPFTLTD